MYWFVSIFIFMYSFTHLNSFIFPWCTFLCMYVSFIYLFSFFVSPCLFSHVFSFSFADLSFSFFYGTPMTPSAQSCWEPSQIFWAHDVHLAPTGFGHKCQGLSLILVSGIQWQSFEPEVGAGTLLSPPSLSVSCFICVICVLALVQSRGVQQ